MYVRVATFDQSGDLDETIKQVKNDVEITRAVIVIKEEIERLREQVQNVE